MQPVAGLAPLPASARKRGEETGVRSISRLREGTSIRSISPALGEKTGLGSLLRMRGQPRLRSLPRSAGEGWGGGASATAMPPARSAP